MLLVAAGELPFNAHVCCTSITCHKTLVFCDALESRPAQLGAEFWLLVVNGLSVARIDIVNFVGAIAPQHFLLCGAANTLFDAFRS